MPCGHCDDVFDWFGLLFDNSVYLLFILETSRLTEIDKELNAIDCLHEKKWYWRTIRYYGLGQYSFPISGSGFLELQGSGIQSIASVTMWRGADARRSGIKGTDDNHPPPVSSNRKGIVRFILGIDCTDYDVIKRSSFVYLVRFGPLYLLWYSSTDKDVSENKSDNQLLAIINLKQAGFAFGRSTVMPNRIALGFGVY